MHKRLRLNTEGIGDTIDVVKKADDLGGIVDGTVIEAVATEHVEVGRTHLLRRFGEFLGIGTQRHILWGESGLAPIATDVVDEQIGGCGISYAKITFDLSTEVMRMRAPSVEAVIDRRGDGGQHFALTATERRRAMHQHAIKVHGGLHGTRVLPHD
ncbi:MAG: hypothetical protein RL076_2150 [Chloroflexota bacterium]